MRDYIASEHVKWGVLVKQLVSRARNRARETRGIRCECCSARGRRDGTRRSCWSNDNVSDGGLCKLLRSAARRFGRGCFFNTAYSDWSPCPIARSHGHRTRVSSPSFLEGDPVTASLDELRTTPPFLLGSSVKLQRIDRYTGLRSRTRRVLGDKPIPKTGSPRSRRSAPGGAAS